jgi:hypothetical protein
MDTVGYAVLYGEGEREDFYFEDGWTEEQVINFSDSVEGLIVHIVALKTLSLEEIFYD